MCRYNSNRGTTGILKVLNQKIFLQVNNSEFILLPKLGIQEDTVQAFLWLHKLFLDISLLENCIFYPVLPHQISYLTKTVAGIILPCHIMLSVTATGLFLVQFKSQCFRCYSSQTSWIGSIDAHSCFHLSDCVFDRNGGLMGTGGCRIP